MINDFPPKPYTIIVFAQAIAKMEGFYVPGSKANKNRNPGNLRSWGNTPVENGFAKFKTFGEGWGALIKQIEKNLFERKLTIIEFFGGKRGIYSGYAPDADGNNSSKYAKFVSDELNKTFGYNFSTPETKLSYFYDTLE